jgi:hypothetical protein
VLGAPALDPLPPGREARRVRSERAVLDREPGEDVARVAHNRDVRGDVLRDLGRIDVDVHELRARGELGQLAGHAVVEARADRDDQVGLVHRVVRAPRAVHSEHAEPLLVRRRERPEAHQRARHRQPVARRQLHELGRGVGVDHAAARVDHRPAGVGERLGGQADLLRVALGGRLVAG